ncbi:MAG: nuclear transport factor 2 family protein [Pseudolabrys sp.]|nr:nuclear transport factor 2 family protein [Pseudolabrys sp.]
MSSNEQSTIEDLENRRYAAMIAGDVHVLDELCSDALIYTHSRGERDDKTSYLAKVASGVFTYHEIDHPNERVLVLSDTALITGRMTAQVSVGGEPRRIDNACLAVWAREAGGWKFVAYQPTPLPSA